MCRIQYSGSLTFWYGSGGGSGSSNPYLWPTDPAPALDPDPDSALFVVTFKTPTQNIFMLISFWRYITSFFKHKKSLRSHKPVEKSRFFFSFLLVNGRIRILANKWCIRNQKIWLRIQKAQKHTAPTNPDPEDAGIFGLWGCWDQRTMILGLLG